MDDIMKIIKFLEESALFIKGVSETTEDQAKEQKGGFLNIILDTLSAGLLANLMEGKRVIRDGEGTVRAGQDF